jgi:hypothetical protein
MGRLEDDLAVRQKRGYRATAEVWGAECYS